MKEKAIFEAVINIQGARLRAASLNTAKPTARDNPLVDLLVMVPKGDKDVTVATNCETSVIRRSFAPLWNETFRLPVLPQSDVLVFRVHKQEELSVDTNSDDKENKHESRILVGVALLPVALMDAAGTVVDKCLEIFARPNEPNLGYLYVSVKIVRSKINLLEQCDVDQPLLRKESTQSHSGRRFLGIGELAAFLFEEGYSEIIADCWNRAHTLLAEQLAFRIYATTDSMNDAEDFRKAWDQIDKEGGLWDGV